MFTDQRRHWSPLNIFCHIHRYLKDMDIRVPTYSETVRATVILASVKLANGVKQKCTSVLNK